MDEELELKDGEMPEGFHEETEETTDPLAEEDDTSGTDPFGDTEDEEEDPDAQEMFSVMYAEYDER